METRFVEDGDGSLIVHRGADVEPLLEANKALYSSGDGYSPSREWRRAATVPMAVIEKWKNELGVDFFNPNDRPRVYALLDSNEYMYLRTAPGRIGKGAHREYSRASTPLVLPNGWERGAPLLVPNG